MSTVGIITLKPLGTFISIETVDLSIEKIIITSLLVTAAFILVA